MFPALLVLPLDLDGKQQALAAVPGLVSLFLGDHSRLYEGLSDRWLDEGVVAVIAAGLLFVLPVNWQERRCTLNRNQASRIDWGTILLFGAGIALGSLMRETGLAKTLGEGLANTLNVSNLLSITIITGVDPGRRHRLRSGVLPIARMVKTGAVFDVIGAVLCVVGVAVMGNVAGLV